MINTEKNSEFSQPLSLMIRFGEQEIDLSHRTGIMGILNVTPDSFSDGGDYYSLDLAVQRGLEMAEAGADIIDVGGESTRPGAEFVDEETEINRTIPVIQELKEKTGAVISIDTRKSRVAFEAVKAGATLINDVSGFVFDSDIVRVAHDVDVPMVLMHSQGTPETMQDNPSYHHVIEEICSFFDRQIAFAIQKGLPRNQLILDPGIGFGKTVRHNYEILKYLSDFQRFGCPILVGVSRKSFIGALLNVSEKKRIFGTAAAVTAAILHGAHIVRVHDVKEMTQVALIADAIKNVAKTAGFNDEYQYSYR